MEADWLEKEGISYWMPTGFAHDLDGTNIFVFQDFLILDYYKSTLKYFLISLFTSIGIKTTETFVRSKYILFIF